MGQLELDCLPELILLGTSALLQLHPAPNTCLASSTLGDLRSKWMMRLACKSAGVGHGCLVGRLVKAAGEPAQQARRVRDFMLPPTHALASDSSQVRPRATSRAICRCWQP